MKNAFFNLGLATLLTHELDTVAQAEWCLIYILRDMPEKATAKAFVIIYMPLFVMIFWLAFNAKSNIREWSKIILAALFMFHIVLYKSLENHPLYTFSSSLSQGLIFGAGLLGFLYLITTYFCSKAEFNSDL